MPKKGTKAKKEKKDVEETKEAVSLIRWNIIAIGRWEI